MYNISKEILEGRNLPNDSEELKAIIMMLVEINKTLEHQLKNLNRKNYGKSSEKINKDKESKEKENQQEEDLQLQIEENESTLSCISAQLGLTGEAEDEAGIFKKVTSELNIKEDEKTKKNNESSKDIDKKNKPKRLAIEENLDQKNEDIEPKEFKCSCGCDNKDDFRPIGQDTSSVMDYIQSSFIKHNYHRKKYACNKCGEIIQGSPKSTPIDKGKAGPGLLAHVIISKYSFSLPFYRQSKIYAMDGVNLPRSTLSNWGGKVAKLLEPLSKEIQKYVLSAESIHADDTVIPVLSPGNGRTKTGRVWVYARDDRQSNDMSAPAVFMKYSADRKKEHPESHLKDYNGFIHADAYSGFNNLYKEDPDGKVKATEVGCWAHTRRKFFEIVANNTNAKIASHVIKEISLIYKIEEGISGKPPEERLKVREEETKPIVDKLFKFVKSAKKDLQKKSLTVKAINYMLNIEAPLREFLGKGSIKIDNNIVERIIRIVAIGRKNYLFAGSNKGGETAALFYSILETAKLNNINPQKYLQYVLKVIPEYNSQKLHELLPWNIKKETLDQYH